MPTPSRAAAELLAHYGRGRRTFMGSDLHDADLRHANLSGADLSRANLSYVHLCDARLSGANLSRANLSRANLSRADLSRAGLSGADLSGADLSGADLSGANLSGADFRHASLPRANLSAANLSCDPIYGRPVLDPRGHDATPLSRLEYVSEGEVQTLVRRFLGDFLANTRGADISDGDLRDVDLSNAVFGATVVCRLDLSQTNGLDTTHHVGPSIVDIDTIYRSRGCIPESFLRGCGVPDSFITYMRSLVGQPIEFYSCFISYSSKDEEFAKRLHARLQQDHLRVWFAPEEMKGGQKLHEQIDEAIRLYDKLLLVLSPHSMASAWVRREIKRALEKERREKRRVLFPIRLCSFDELRAWECLDSDTGVDMAEEVRSYFIPDFSSWKDHDSFEAGVARLIKDLRAEGKDTQAPDRS